VGTNYDIEAPLPNYGNGIVVGGTANFDPVFSETKVCWRDLVSDHAAVEAAGIVAVHVGVVGARTVREAVEDDEVEHRVGPVALRHHRDGAGGARRGARRRARAAREPEDDESESLGEHRAFIYHSGPPRVTCSARPEHRCAVRVSEFESIETALTLSGKVDWVWVDCFTKFPLSDDDAVRLRNAGFKLCLVSPELQGRDAEIEIPALVSLLRERNIESDAVCTKRPDLWEKMVFAQ
jgi:hypothetical protein